MSALSWTPATCTASKLAMARTLSDETRPPSAVNCAADKPSTCAAVSAATRIVSAPIRAANCVAFKVPRPAAAMPANCVLSRLAMAETESAEALAPKAVTCCTVNLSTWAAVNAPT